jgi:hypothetical protein
MKDDDQAILMCKPVADGPAEARGSVQANCCDCDQLVWVSESSAALRAKENPLLMCLPCVLKRNPDPEEFMPPTDEIADELRELGIDPDAAHKEMMENLKP